MSGAQVIEIVVSWVVTNALTFAVVIVDTRRLTEERLERAWPPASRDAAIVAFGLLALPFHFAKTRGSWTTLRGVGGRVLGFVVGVLVAAVVAVASAFLIGVIAWAIGLPEIE
ncbi:MAG: hypothetical protein KIS78_38025 [Labilithrix sp.]|nr:hypothetical protein [Labilithrix sp.]MCW5838253.1 hypothetical protein [Labilithrix sp.]